MLQTRTKIATHSSLQKGCGDSRLGRVGGVRKQFTKILTGKISLTTLPPDLPESAG